MLNNINQKILRVAKKIVNYEERLDENRQLKEQIERLKNELENLRETSKTFGWPAGHYYSPVHKLEDLKDFDEVKARSCDKFAKSIPGFSDKKMLIEFNKIKNFFSDYDYPETDNGKSRYYIKNCSYPITDSLILFSMIRFLKPKRIIEIGSGFTSALMMDVNERFFNNKINITFIEPYPELLIQRMKKKDRSKYEIVESGVQFVSLEIFKTLKKGDVLFIDSTHVSKFNSDVNYELFEILPIIKPGVIIHFHDICDGFEYPLIWLKDGWAWNEAYLIRAYLMGNNNYDVLLMNNYLTDKHSKFLLDSFTRLKEINGSSLWIKKNS